MDDGRRRHNSANSRYWGFVPRIIMGSCIYMVDSMTAMASPGYDGPVCSNGLTISGGFKLVKQHFRFFGGALRLLYFCGAMPVCSP